MRVFAAMLLCCTVAIGHAEVSGPAVPDLTGTLQHPLDAGQQAASVLIFYWHDCPICNSYAPEINRLRDHYTNFNFYIVQVDPDLTLADARSHAQDYGFRMPVLLDGRHALVRLAGATVAPEAVIFDKNEKMLYRGRIDNLYSTLGTRRLEATKHDLRDALDAIAAGKSVKHQPPPIGCIIP
jgi:thiol-disulfide isomerase/thioredoxin